MSYEGIKHIKYGGDSIHHAYNTVYAQCPRAWIELQKVMDPYSTFSMQKPLIWNLILLGLRKQTSANGQDHQVVKNGATLLLWPLDHLIPMQNNLLVPDVSNVLYI